jgi:hypothetical protein
MIAAIHWRAIMIFIGHLLLFIAIGGAAYGFAIDRQSNWPVVVMIAAPIIGVYFLGWWSLATWLFAFMSGNRAYVQEIIRNEKK